MIRKHLAGFAASALAMAVSVQALAGAVTTDGPDLVIKTKGGLEVATTDKAFSFKLGGRLQWDATQFDGLMAADQKKAFDKTFNTFIRRGEIGMEGTAYSDWGWGIRLNYDETDDTKVDRAFITYSGFDLLDVTVGRFGGDYGLENTTSSSWITAIERPFIYDFLNGDEDTVFGVNLKHGGDNYGVSARVGNYSGDMEYKHEGNDELLGYTLRGTWAPYLQGTDVVHLGLNYHNSSPDDNRSRARTRMGIRSDHDYRLTFADVRESDKDAEFMLEAGAQFGSVRAQTEYFQRSMDGKTAAGDKAKSDLKGYSAQVSYMFEGAARGYKVKDGSWDKPNNMNGTWEVFARYDHATIDSDANAIPSNLGSSDYNVTSIVAKDRADAFKTKAMTLGVNYFATPAVRMSLNYVDYAVDNINTSTQVRGKDVQDDGKAIIGRLQYVF